MLSVSQDPTTTCVLVLGDQLFSEVFRKSWGSVRQVFMAESWDLCRHFKYHKQKILLFLASMRHYRDELKKAGYDVTYLSLDEKTQEKTFSDLLKKYLSMRNIRTLIHFEVSDRFFERDLVALCSQMEITRVCIPSPGFLTSRQDFADYVVRHPKPKMQSFYQEQRLRLHVMVEGGKPWGGKWSFDTENRKKLPVSVKPPRLPRVSMSSHAVALKPDIERWFPEHPGLTDSFIWPVTREGALNWLGSFLEERFSLFGPYEDAITQRSDFVFHSVLSPILNIGLLTPGEVLNSVLKHAADKSIDLASLEGFVRQLIGWREFIFGIDRNFGKKQEKGNFFSHERRLGSSWYSANTGLEPLDYCISKAVRLGYIHHIERLMIVSNVMLLCEVHPQDVYKWFMELFVDSADWVMGPNVYGMGQFSDGGLFATKPYIGGSNYVLKMSDFTKGPWCDVMDGLYWRFISRHRVYFTGQPRLSMMARMLDKISPQRLKTITEAAERFIDKNTV